MIPVDTIRKINDVTNSAPSDNSLSHITIEMCTKRTH